MKRTVTAAVIAGVLFGATACPQKPQPFCPGNVCSKAPTSISPSR
jgi:hypothetical protein